MITNDHDFNLEKYLNEAKIYKKCNLHIGKGISAENALLVLNSLIKNSILLTHLTISGFSDDTSLQAAKLLSQLFVIQQNLEIIDLHNNTWWDEGFKEFSFALTQCKKLQALNLANTCLSTKSAKILLVLLPNLSVRSLILGGNAFTAADVPVILKGLEANHSLEAFSLSGNLMGDQGFIHFIHFLKNSVNQLKNIYLSRCNISDAGIKNANLILQHFTHHSCVQFVLESNQFTDVNLFQTFVKSFPKLQKLDLLRNPFDFNGIRSFKNDLASLALPTLLKQSLNRFIKTFWEEAAQQAQAQQDFQVAVEALEEFLKIDPENDEMKQLLDKMIGNSHKAKPSEPEQPVISPPEPDDADELLLKELEALRNKLMEEKRLREEIENNRKELQEAYDDLKVQLNNSKQPKPIKEDPVNPPLPPTPPPVPSMPVVHDKPIPKPSFLDDIKNEDKPRLKPPKLDEIDLAKNEQKEIKEYRNNLLNTIKDAMKNPPADVDTLFQHVEEELESLRLREIKVLNNLIAFYEKRKITSQIERLQKELIALKMTPPASFERPQKDNDEWEEDAQQTMKGRVEHHHASNKPASSYPNFFVAGTDEVSAATSITPAIEKEIRHQNHQPENLPGAPKLK